MLFQAASGIGKETAIAFAQAGSIGVVLADINEKGAQAAAEECDTLATHPTFRATAVKVDITNEASVDNMVSVALKEFDRIDYSVNSAGVRHLPLIIQILTVDNQSESSVR